MYIFRKMDTRTFKRLNNTFLTYLTRLEKQGSILCVVDILDPSLFEKGNRISRELNIFSSYIKIKIKKKRGFTWK